MTNIKDQLNAASSERTQVAAFSVLDAIQGIQPKGLQLSAVAFLFLLMCRRFNEDPREVLDKTDRRITDTLSVGRGEYTRAIQNYLKEEL